MKIQPECIPCLISRAKFEADLCIKDENVKLKALREFLSFLNNNLNENVVPAILGTGRYRIIRKYSNQDDIYKRLKDESNKKAKMLLDIIKKHRRENELSFLLKLAAIANGFEFGVKEHTFPKNIEKEYKNIFKSEIIGNVNDAINAIETYDRILYILDNCGEFIIDLYVIEKLEKKYNKKIIVAAKSDFILDDATIYDVKKYYNGEVVSSGKSVGINLDEADKKFKEFLYSKNILVISKGMGNYETLSEYEDMFRCRLIYILKAKCSSVAKSLNVPRGSLVIKKI